MCLANDAVRSSGPALFVGLLLLLAPRSTPAEEPFSASRTVIVVDGATEVFAGNESIDQIRPGSIVRYSRENGPWLLIPRYAGWINKDQVLPIETAVAHFNALIHDSPGAQAYQHRGIVRCHLGEYAAALADFQRAADMGLDDAGLYINRGVAHQRAGSLRAAIDDYTQAIRRDATNAQAYDNRSSALAELEEWDESLADSNEAIRLDPKYAEAFNNRGVTYRLQGAYARAIEDYDAAIELFRGYSAAFANRGYARKQLGQYAAAAADYEEALKLDPDFAQAHNDFAWMLATCADAGLRDATLATKHAQQACELTGMSNGEFLDTLAAAHAAGGEFDQAVDFGEQALKLIDDGQKPAVQQRLELYRQQTPFFEQ